MVSSRFDAPGPQTSPPSLGTQCAAIDIRDRGLDILFLCAVFALVAIGTVEIYSSSAVYALKKHGDGMYFLKRQEEWVPIGLAALWAVGAFAAGALTFRRLQGGFGDVS